MSKLVLNEIADKYYTQLEAMVNDLANKCIGGEETKIVFNNGTVTFKLK